MSNGENTRLPKINNPQTARRLRVLAYKQAIEELLPEGGDYVEFFEAIGGALKDLSATLQTKIDEENGQP